MHAKSVAYALIRFNKKGAPNGGPSTQHGKLMRDQDIPDGYVRVTEILKPYVDLSHIDPFVLEKAADRGSRVHEYCASYCAAHAVHAHLFWDLEHVDADCAGYVQSFIEWYINNVDKLILCEKRLNCAKTKVTGKPDLIVQLKGDDAPTLVDIKTPVAAQKTWRIQTAAYHWLAVSAENIDCKRRICIQLKKDGGKAKIIEHSNLKVDVDVFLGLAEAYFFFNS